MRRQVGRGKEPRAVGQVAPLLGRVEGDGVGLAVEGVLVVETTGVDVCRGASGHALTTIAEGTSVIACALGGAARPCQSSTSTAVQGHIAVLPGMPIETAAAAQGEVVRRGIGCLDFVVGAVEEGFTFSVLAHKTIE